ncbi:MAG: hypothetical protein KAJ86_02930 [Alphaproteobacteria bacterium]|nr:hypothetical protein [Alphaproteobacteria bacterium]
MLISIFYSGISIAASNGRCFAPKPEMQFSATISKVKYNISESAFSLHNMHSGGGSGIVTGLAYDSLFYEYESLYRIHQMKDGGICVYLDKIKVKYRARPIVFISSEFPRGSCEFNAVLTHENKHVTALKKFHKQSTSTFKKDVENTLKRLRPVGPVSKMQIRSAQERIEKQISELLDRSILKVRNDLSKAQNKIDSPEEYARVNAQCKNWEQRLRLE